MMNVFLKKLMEFADYCGNIEHFNAYEKKFATVEGCVRDGRHKFSICIRFEEMKEGESNGTEELE